MSYSMRFQRPLRNLVFGILIFGCVSMAWFYGAHYNYNTQIYDEKLADGRDGAASHLHFRTIFNTNPHNTLGSRTGVQMQVIPESDQGIKPQLASVDMVRDVAKDIKWSADKTFELDLMDRCAKKTYDLSSLPTASVIICFHGTESLTRLLHTIHSIVQHSPRQLLHEIILLADNTQTESHQSPLKQYAQFVFPGLIRIHRSTIQLGLIKCRQLGASLAKGDAIISMDSHMELRIGWIEPLLYEIHKNKQTMVTPYLDWMTEQPDGSWQYEYGCSRYKTVWYWKEMGFTFMEIPDAIKNTLDPTEPIISPVTVGTVWAMDRQFFFDIGGLDEGMNLWGGENIDLPIRVVMAGGRHVNVPCSHAAHCAPTGSRDYRIGHQPEINYKRVIETLFTPEYKEAIYYYNPHWKALPLGDISKRQVIATAFKHNFSYYMEHADVEHLAPNVNTLAWDGIKNLGVSRVSAEACMFIDFSTWLIKLTGCVEFDRHTAGLFLTNEGELHNSNHIIMSNLVDESLTIGNYVGVINTSQVDRWMHKKSGMIQWYPDRKRLASGTVTPHPQCITVIHHDKEPPNLKVSLKRCNNTDPYQQWEFGIYTQTYSNFVNQNIFPMHKQTESSHTFYKDYKTFLKSQS